jgi:hypothetical protein
LLRKAKKSLRPPSRQKKLTTENAEPAEIFRVKTKKDKSFTGEEHLFGFRSSGGEDKRMNEEKAENAEIAVGKPLAGCGLPGMVRKSTAFPPTSRR